MTEIPKPEILCSFSDRTLQALLLASRDREARHIKTAKIAVDEAAREGAIALTAEWFLEHRATLALEALAMIEGKPEREAA